LIIIYGFIFVIINYFYFTYDKHYIKIYNKFKISNKNNGTIELLSWAYVITGFISVPIVALIIR